MSDTSRVQLAYVAESSFGVQKTGSNLQILRITGESLKQDVASSQSNEIRSDRQIASIRRSRITASGGVNFELSYGTYDALLAAALLDSAWGSPVAVCSSATVSAAASGNKFTGTFTAPTAGEWIKVSGFTNAANNGYFKVVTASTSEITVSGGTLVDEASATGISITQGGSIVNGTSLSTFNLERTYDDLSSELSLFLGMAINGLSLNVPVEGEITGGLEFLGSSESSETASGGTGYDPATQTEHMTALDVQNLLENQAAMSIRAFSLSLNNNLRQRAVVGSSGVLSIGTGRCIVSGTLEAYYASKTVYDKYLNGTATALAVSLQDPAGNGYVIDLPAVKYTAGQRVAGGPDDDVMVPLSWSAHAHATEDVTMRIARFPVA
ncbi:MAG TPA: phage tail tube protein [Sedimentisphaerales bacterium]|nr:phage tail tube protein [Sedimentisphaerales bacterium]